MNLDDIDVMEGNPRDEMGEYGEPYASVRWCSRVQSWLELYRSGYLARAARPSPDQIIAALEREAIQGELLAWRLGEGEERELVLGLVRQLDAIGNELCDLSVGRLTGLMPETPVGFPYAPAAVEWHPKTAREVTRLIHLTVWVVLFGGLALGASWLLAL